jgi:hypothetical protein
MKPNSHLSIFSVIAVAALGTFFVSGCAEMESNNTKSLLSAAGFHVRTPQTPLQKEVYAALQPYRVERISYKGKTLYAYKDEKAGVAYVGREPEYQRYCHLCVEQKIAQDYYAAVQMDQMYANRWYGAWGPRWY